MTIEDEPVTIDDARKAGFCARGVREICKTEGLDVRRLVRGGYTIGFAESLNNGYANAIARVARERVGVE